MIVQACPFRISALRQLPDERVAANTRIPLFRDDINTVAVYGGFSRRADAVATTRPEGPAVLGEASDGVSAASGSTEYCDDRVVRQDMETQHLTGKGHRPQKGAINVKLDDLASVVASRGAIDESTHQDSTVVPHSKSSRPRTVRVLRRRQPSHPSLAGPRDGTEYDAEGEDRADSTSELHEDLRVCGSERLVAERSLARQQSIRLSTRPARRRSGPAASFLGPQGLGFILNVAYWHVEHYFPSRLDVFPISFYTLNATMNVADIRSYVQRWRRVNDREREELRTTPAAVKLAQLAALMESARLLGWETKTSAEVEAVRQRWNRLRNALLR